MVTDNLQLCRMNQMWRMAAPLPTTKPLYRPAIPLLVWLGSFPTVPVDPRESPFRFLLVCQLRYASWGIVALFKPGCFRYDVIFSESGLTIGHIFLDYEHMPIN